MNTIVAETEDEKCNTNNVTTDTLTQPPISTNAPREKTDVANERRIYSDCLT